MASAGSASRSRGDGMECEKPSSMLPSPSEGAASASASAKAMKRPKFVPYEPYKGAVRPMVPAGAGAAAGPGLQMVPIRVPPPKYSRQKRASTSSAGSGSGQKQRASLDEEMASLDLADRNVEAVEKPLTSDVVELRKELKIQHEINAELKNLLVASIGEDWETRVQSLSTDKAILGEYVKQYSDSLTRQSEEKDNISIECDVWRSKFLASSLMVDELARCKAILVCRCQEAREALQTLSEEHSRFVAEIRELNRNLKACQSYVDGVREPERPGAGAADAASSEDVMRLVSEANMRSSLVLRSLRDRHKYNEARSRPSSPDFRGYAGGREEHVPMTPAQTRAAKVLADLLDMPYVVNENLKSASALYFPINKALPFKCCTHCQGDLKIV